MQISQQMQDALTQCVIARAMYKANPTQDNLSTWDDKWTSLMEVRYAQPVVGDPTWVGLATREEQLMPDAMAIVAAAQRTVYCKQSGLALVKDSAAVAAFK